MDIRFCNTSLSGWIAICLKAHLAVIGVLTCSEGWAWANLGIKPVVFSAALQQKLFRNMPMVANLPNRMFVALTFWFSYQHEKSTERYFYTCLANDLIQYHRIERTFCFIFYLKCNPFSQPKFMVPIVLFYWDFPFPTFFFFNLVFQCFGHNTSICASVIPLAERWDFSTQTPKLTEIKYWALFVSKCWKPQFPALSLWTEKWHLGQICCMND